MNWRDCIPLTARSQTIGISAGPKGCSECVGRMGPAGPGDMDGDGFPELAVSSRWVGIDAAGGQVYVYRGGPSVGAAPAVIVHPATW